MNPTKLLVISSEAGWHVAQLDKTDDTIEELVNWMVAQGYTSSDWSNHIQACTIAIYPGRVDTEEIHLSDPVLAAIDEDIFEHHEF